MTIHYFKSREGKRERIKQVSHVLIKLIWYQLWAKLVSKLSALAEKIYQQSFYLEELWPLVSAILSSLDFVQELN